METATAVTKGTPPQALEAKTLCEAFQMTAAERPDQVALRVLYAG